MPTSDLEQERCFSYLHCLKVYEGINRFRSSFIVSLVHLDSELCSRKTNVGKYIITYNIHNNVCNHTLPPTHTYTLSHPPPLGYSECKQGVNSDCPKSHKCVRHPTSVGLGRGGGGGKQWQPEMKTGTHQVLCNLLLSLLPVFPTPERLQKRLEIR